MSTDKQIVAEKIKSGTYYKDALEWFHNRYVRPQTELSTMVILCLMALTAFGIGVSAFSKVFPLSPEVPIVLNRSFEVEEFMTLNHIDGRKASNVNQAYAKYFLSEYVKSREEYREKRLDRNFNFVATISSPEVFDQFSMETSTSNPNNPKLVYGNKAEIYIQVHGVKLVDSVNQPVKITDNNISRALVTYSSILVFDDGTQQATTHQADISFQYQQIIVDQITNEVTQKPELVITSYKTKSL